MDTRQVFKKQWTEKPIQRIRGNPGNYWVQSEKHKQLWYKVTMRIDTNEIRCVCKGWKFGKGELCKHMLKVLQLEGGQTDV